jgi:hypothetical protein
VCASSASNVPEPVTDWLGPNWVQHVRAAKWALTRSPPRARPSASNFRQVGNPGQSVLAGERKGLVAALRLRDTEYAVRPGVVDGDSAVIIDHQPAGVGKDGVSGSFCAPTAPGVPNPAGHQSAALGVERKLTRSSADREPPTSGDASRYCAMSLHSASHKASP